MRRESAQRIFRWLQSHDSGWIAAALFPLAGILPAVSGGTVRTADGIIHVHRIQAMTLFWQQGILWPRWVSYFHLGYGYPLFNFYPPLVYFFGAGLGLLGISAPDAFNLIMAGSWILGAVGAYALARRFLPAQAAVLGALLWAYAPSRIHEVWQQGSLSQMMGAAFIPWLFLALAHAARRPTRRNFAAIGVLYAAVILSHLPIAVMTTLFLAAAIILLPLRATFTDRRTYIKRALHLAGGAALGVGLCAIFVLPVAVELPIVQAPTQDPLPILMSSFLQPGEVFSSIYQPQDLTDIRIVIPATLGLTWGLLSLGGIGALLRHRRFGLALILAVGIGIAAFMALEVSLPIWKAVPFLANARFPGRIFRIGAVFIALAGGACLLWLPARWRNAALVVLTAGVLLAALPWTYPVQDFVQWPSGLSAQDEIAFELVEHDWGTTSYDEFDPIWGAAIPLDPPPEPEAYAAHPFRLIVRRADIIRQWPDLQVEELDDDTVRVTVTEEMPVRFRQYYFPGWTATLDGEAVEPYPEAEMGLLTVDAPAGEHIITLRYTGTPDQMAGTLISLLSAGLALALLWRGGEKQAVSQNKGKALSPRFGQGLIAGIVVFTLVNTFIIGPHTLLFRHRSPPDAPVYMETPVHAFFGDAIELLGYTLHRQSVQPGGTLDITLYWRIHAELTQRYGSVVQLVNLPVSEAWGVEPPLPSLTTQVDVYSTADRFLSEAHRLQISGNVPPYAGRIKVAVTDDEGNLLPTTGGADYLLLDPLIRVQGSGPTAARTLDYRFGEGLSLVCASVTHSADQIDIQLYWHVDSPPGQDVTAFVHGLDDTGQLIAQNDTPPLGGSYPASLWLPGQNLADHYALPADSRITAVAFGLYRSDDLERLPVTHDGQAAPDNQIMLPMEEAACLP